MAELDDTKACMFCGEAVKRAAVRCKHCRSDLPVVEAVPPAPVDFEQRFLEFAFRTSAPLNTATVAYALKISLTEASDRLEDLAARDILLREVDDRGLVYFKLPGRPHANHGSTALVPYGSSAGSALMPMAPGEGAAMAGLLLNVLLLPGLGSLVAGRTGDGVAQLVLCLVGLPLCLLGFVAVGLPLWTAAWVWSLITGIRCLNEAKATAET